MLLIYTAAYLLGTLLYYLGHNIIASGVIIALAIFLYFIDFIDTKRLINIRGIFGLTFIGAFGISLLKLSKLSTSYNVMTFLVVYVSYFSLYVGVYAAGKKDYSYMNIKKMVKKTTNKTIASQDVLYFMFIIITCISFISEAFILKFIPFFVKNTPHAYSTFHVYGLHYITTLYVFIPSLAICNYYLSENKSTPIKQIIFAYIYIILLAVFMVSRSQLILSVLLSLFVWFIYSRKTIFESIISGTTKNVKLSGKFIGIILISFILFIALYIVITISRSHDIVYLNSIFEMKNEKTPIFITQPYMYIAHNFENLNYMIENLFRWTFGRRTLYPFFTLMLIKKFFPVVTDSPLYIIKEELSTKTIVYDFYYDFGLVGVVIFCFITGYVGKMIEEKAYRRVDDIGFFKNNYVVVLFALCSYYMFFSFFQTYFSQTDTWVNIIIIIILMLFVKTPYKIHKQSFKSSGKHVAVKPIVKKDVIEETKVEHIDTIETGIENVIVIKSKSEKINSKNSTDINHNLEKTKNIKAKVEKPVDEVKDNEGKNRE